MTDCERCGSTDDVRTFYGREECNVADEWQACGDCRLYFLKKRISDSVDEKEEPTTTPEPEPEPDPTGLSDFM